MTFQPQHIRAGTTHARRGNIRHVFTHAVDYVLIDPEARAGPALFRRNRAGLCSVHDRHHGGPPKHGRGRDWAEQVFRGAGLQDVTILLLTQPAVMGRVFNPVSFWLAMRGPALVAVIAEVTNTFGDRHSYLCHLPGFAPIAASDEITAQKLMHVSPFQDVAGRYRFKFRVDPDRIAIRITHEHGDEGVIATLTGPRRALTNTAILRMSLARPFGAARTWALIHWHAARLKLKGAAYRRRPDPPKHEVS